ncbi:MAG TPA: hypothetical protein VG488_12195 [Candidatus Angelobacter sp.]|jgi:hypothetical protein|nr:hypothetical protein [Candidatus Angelobacter sp.]
MMRDFTWSKTEKTIARKAFDEAYNKECKVVVARVKDLMADLPEPRAIWVIHDYLSQRRKETDEKYDYRYSVLPLVFAKLIEEGWLTLDNLQGLNEEKIRMIQTMLNLADLP